MRTDAELIEGSLAGDGTSFDELVRRYRDVVQSLAYCWMADFHQAEDVAQETMVTVYLRLGQLRQVSSFPGWLRQVTRNQCRKAARQQGRLVPSDEVEELAVAADSTPQALEVEEMRALVHAGLRRLSEANRMVMALHYLAGLSYQEIARFLEVPLTTVEGRMHRGSGTAQQPFIATCLRTLSKMRSCVRTFSPGSRSPVRRNGEQ